MHRALHIQEVVAAIIGHVQSQRCNPTLAALARTCYAFTELALDALWEQPLPWYLAMTMSEDLWTIGIERSDRSMDLYEIDTQYILVRARAAEICITL
jgi:hypothetical protein